MATHIDVVCAVCSVLRAASGLDEESAVTFLEGFASAEWIKDALRLFSIDGEYGRWLWQGLVALLCLLCLYWVVRALINRKRRQWDMLYFGLLCFAVFAWAAVTLLLASNQYGEYGALLSYIQTAGIVFLPCLLHLHVWKQVSFKDLSPTVLIAILAVPAALMGWLGYRSFPAAWPRGQLRFSALWGWAYCIYAFLTFLRCYLRCFNVLYQMPKHMRLSSYNIITATTFLVGVNVLFCLDGNLWGGVLAVYHVPLYATGLALYYLYWAMYANSSANVIATGRDIAFGSLTTMVLILSRSMRILDWNWKEKGAALLPWPRYNERFERYRNRIIREGEGQVSPHGKNIILTNYGSEECQYLIRINPIQNKHHVFGYLAEITKITSVYSVLRLFEEIATIDQLTGLLNRNAYLAKVQACIEENVLPLWIIVGDLNNLKILNDRLGHLAGDKLLKTISRLIRETMPNTASAYRIGGDEFVLLVPGTAPGAVTGFIAAMDRKCAATHDELFGTPSISWGYAVRTSPGQDFNEVFQQADKMMYATKKVRHRFTSSGIIPPSVPVGAVKDTQAAAPARPQVPTEALNEKPGGRE